MLKKNCISILKDYFTLILTARKFLQFALLT